MALLRKRYCPRVHPPPILLALSKKLRGQALRDEGQAEYGLLASCSRQPSTGLMQTSSDLMKELHLEVAERHRYGSVLLQMFPHEAPDVHQIESMVTQVGVGVGARIPGRR